MSVLAESGLPTDSLPSPEAVLGQAADENFPVALGVLGARARRGLMAIYGFARLVDDVGDEAPGDRLALLDVVEEEIDRIYSGREPEHPLMRRLADAVEECEFPRAALERLVQANRQDQTVTRYETFEDLLGYCQLSAAPVGELVLHVFGQATPERIALSDLVCDGLQVIEHLQDVVEDRSRGRIYLPLEDLRRFGCSEADLDRMPPTPEVVSAVAFEAQRAGALLDAGSALAGELRGRCRVAVAGFVAGGRSALRGLKRNGYDISRPRAPRDRLAFGVAFAATVAGR